MNKKQTDYIWPIDLKYKVLEHDKYGLRKKHMILGKERWHSGFDITTRTKTPVKASSSGIVIAAGLDEKIVSGSANWNERYGIKVEILDKFSRRVVYAHLRTVSVTVGQYIKQGQIITSKNVSLLNNFPLVENLNKEFNKPIFLDHQYCLFLLHYCTIFLNQHK